MCMYFPATQLCSTFFFCGGKIGLKCWQNARSSANKIKKNLVPDCSIDFPRLQVIWLIHVCDVTCYDVFIYGTLLLCSFTKTNYFWDRSIDFQSLQVAWLIHVCDVTWAHVWYYDSFTFVTLLHYSFTKTSCFRDRSIDFESLQVAWLIHVCDLTWAHVCYYKSFMHVTSLIHKKKSSSRLLDRFEIIQVTWLIHVCGVTWAHVWYYDSFLYVISLILKKKWCSRSLNTLPKPFGHDSYKCVTWLERMRDIMTDSHVCDITYSQQEVIFESARLTLKAFGWHDSSMCVTWSIRMCDIISCWHVWRYLFTKRSHFWDCSIDFESFQVMRLLHVCGMTWAHVWYYDSFIYVTLRIHKNKSSSRSLDWLWKLSVGMIHSCVWLGLCAYCILSITYICDIPYSQKEIIFEIARFSLKASRCHESFMCATWLGRMCDITTHYICDIT